MLKTSRGASTAPVGGGQFPVGFHHGNVLQYLAMQYSSVPAIIGEMVQNFLDKQANTGVIEVTLGDKRQNCIRSWDDGQGASKDELAHRIANIGGTQKKKGQIGHKGIGNLAPLAIGDRYSMITRPGGRGSFFRVFFDKPQIASQAEVGFTWEDMDEAWRPDEGNKVSTLITVRSIEASAFRQLNESDNPALLLAERVADSFSSVIQERNASITIKVRKSKKDAWQTEIVTPNRFFGRKQVITINTKKGPVIFEMYLTSDKQKHPKLLIEHNKVWSFDLHHLSDISMLHSDVFDSGLIQGVIKVDFCTLTPDRQGFQFDADREALSMAIDEFVKEYAEPFLEEVEDVSRLNSWSKIALDILESVSPDIIPDGLNAFVSKSHKKSGSRDTIQRSKPKESRQQFGEDEESSQPSLEGAHRKRVTHKSAHSPTGSRRFRVGSDKGLAIDFVEGDQDRGFKWHVAVEGGKVLFNVTHQDWRESEDAGKTHLRTYIAILLMRVIASSKLPEGWDEIFETSFDEEFMPLRKMLVPRMGRRPNKK